MVREIAISQVIDRIRFENLWWVGKGVDNYFQKMPRRAYFPQFARLCQQQDVNRSVVLMGPRRVGKTVMLYHLVVELLNAGVPPRRILFITVENPIYNYRSLEELFKLGRLATGAAEEDGEGWFVIFDEIQYLKEWDVQLKVLTESYRNTRFIVSGSAAAALQFKSRESGAGRFTDFMLPPLTFFEFINMQRLDGLVRPTALTFGGKSAMLYEAIDIKQLNNHFIDYVNYGGYPEAIFNESIRNNPERFIRNDVVDKVLLRDLPGLYGIANVQDLNSLFTTIAYNTAQEFSPDKLASQSGISKATINRFLEYLEAAFLIRKVQRINRAGQRFQRETAFKLYLTNTALRAALFSPIQATDNDMGTLAETAIFGQWLHRENFTPWYANWRDGEVDMVCISPKNLKPLWAVEVKWSDRYEAHPKELKSLLQFCKENNLSQALVTSLSVQSVKEYQDVRLTFIPSAAYAYTVSANTLKL